MQTLTVADDSNSSLLIRVIRANPWSNCFASTPERIMPKHIGIVACSAEGAALCYRTICDEAPALMGRHMHPEVSMHTHCLGEYMEYIYRGRLAGCGRPDAVVGQQAVEAGADFLICPDNTIHHALRSGRAAFAPALAAHRGRGRRRGEGSAASASWRLREPSTPWKARSIRRSCRRRASNTSFPTRTSARASMHIIFDELVNGIFTANRANYFQQVIGRMSTRAATRWCWAARRSRC